MPLAGCTGPLDVCEASGFQVETRPRFFLFFSFFSFSWRRALSACVKNAHLSGSSPTLFEFIFS